MVHSVKVDTGAGAEINCNIGVKKIERNSRSTMMTNVEEKELIWLSNVKTKHLWIVNKWT